MEHSRFSPAIRVLACDRCGGPVVSIPAGGQFQCDYCGSVNIVGDRAETGRRAPAAEEMPESERLARLRDQSPDWLALPSWNPATARAQSVPAAAEEWLRLYRECRQLASPLLTERLVVLTLQLAPEQRDPASRRALIESAMEITQDARHRYVLRCRLSLEATSEGDTDAAAQWLERCDPRPLDRAMDSAYRVARAMIALERDEPREVLAQLGHAEAPAPLARHEEGIAGVMRAWASARIEGVSGAPTRAGSPPWSHPSWTARVIAASACAFAPRLSRWLRWARAGAEEEAAGKAWTAAAARLHARSSWHARFTILALTGVLGGLAVALASSAWSWTVLSLFGADPSLVGVHAALVCPRVCSDCVGPYRVWTLGDPDRRWLGSRAFCSDEAGRTARTTNHELARLWNDPNTWVHRQRIAGGVGTLAFVSALLCAGPGVLIGMLAGARRSRRRVGEARSALDAAERRMQERAAAQAQLERTL